MSTSAKIAYNQETKTMSNKSKNLPHAAFSDYIVMIIVTVSMQK